MTVTTDSSDRQVRPEIRGKTIELRPYQQEAVSSILQSLRTHRTTLLILATGLGKTVTFGAVAQIGARHGRRVLVVAHREELIDQAAETLRRFGLSVAIERADQRVDSTDLPDVTIASLQTMRGKRLERFPSSAFALVIIDEAHHATAKSYRAILDHFETAKVLGVTATPDRADGTGLGKVFDSVAYRMEIGDGMRGGFLAPIVLRSVTVEGLDLSTIRVRAGDFDRAALEAELRREDNMHAVAGSLAALIGDRQTLAFTAGVQQAHDLAACVRARRIRAAAVDGSTPRDERERIRDAYRAGEIQVVANAMIWTEGFDAPETSCVALIRPTRSRSLISQMIGRGLRLAPGKTDCLVLDFVPERAGKFRLASPADALAGSDVSDEVAAIVQRLSIEGTGALEDLIQRAKAEQLALDLEEQKRKERDRDETARLVREVGVIYAVTSLDVSRLLAAVGGGGSGRPATPEQIAALEKQGIKPPDGLTFGDAKALFDIIERRRRAGLCSLKQAKKLRSYGLRDDVSSADAREALKAIEANGWKPPAWLYGDPRFARAGEKVA